MIPNPAKQRAQRDYLEAHSAVERANQQFAYNELRAQAKTLYYEWVVLRKKDAVLTEDEELLRFLIKLAQVRYPYNQSGLNSIYEAEARLGMHLNDHAALLNQIRQQNIALNTLMNVPKNQVYTVDTTLDITRKIVLVDTAALAASRSDIRSLEQSIRLQRLNQRREALEGKPEFGLQYSHMNSLGRMPNQFTLMGMVTVPIAPWSARKYKANQEAIGYEIEALERERESLLNVATGTLASLIADIETRRQQIENYEQEILPALKKNYEVTLRAYEQNTAQLPLVINAWDTLKMTQIQYLDTMEAFLKLQIAYEKELEK